MYFFLFFYQASHWFFNSGIKILAIAIKCVPDLIGHKILKSKTKTRILSLRVCFVATINLNNQFLLSNTSYSILYTFSICIHFIFKSLFAVLYCIHIFCFIDCLFIQFKNLKAYLFFIFYSLLEYGETSPNVVSGRLINCQ